MSKPDDTLNALLRGELSAVETYSMALKKAKTPHVIEVLTECQQQHQARVQKLTVLVTSAGGTPTTESGLWGSIAKAVEAGAVVLGEGSAIGSLKEGEDHGIELYKSEMKHLEGSALAAVQNELFPAQEITQKAISKLADKSQ
jgi:uncharacterized protein (TIGR02284 family)